MTTASDPDEVRRAAQHGTGVVLRVVALTGFTIGVNSDGDPAGRLIASIDVDAYEGRGEVTLTEDPALALVFPSFPDAWAAWQQQSKRRPFRPDGQPNRPVTAYTVSIEAAPAGAGTAR